MTLGLAHRIKKKLLLENHFKISGRAFQKKLTTMLNTHTKNYTEVHKIQESNQIPKKERKRSSFQHPPFTPPPKGPIATW